MPRAIIASLAIVACYRVATVRTSFQIFPYLTNGAFVQSGVKDINYYIMST
jgi:hypothetical protein